ncbi:MAG: DUF5722 domain-containing protein [Lachnospiraceae bacterium]|nr:DUF5722 domain-containing protein [Lachnospiraceae bacterium]
MSDDKELQFIQVNRRAQMPEDENVQIPAGNGARRPGDRRRRRRKKSRKPLFVLALILIVGIIFAGLELSGVIDLIPSESDNPAEAIINEEDLIDTIPEKIEGNENIGAGIIKHILTAMAYTENAYAERPKTIELTDENRADFAKISQCLIDPETKNVNLTVTSEGIPQSDDKYYYLFEFPGYVDDPVPGETFIAKAYKNDNSELTFPLVEDGNTRLYKKFGVAVKVNGEFLLVSRPSFVTNPEDISKYPNAYMEARSKKGILIDYNRVFTGQLEDLGVNQAAINIPLASILGPTTNPLFPSIHYTYNGKTYTFNGVIVAGFDSTVQALTQKGIQTTAIILNNYTSAYIDIIHPDARQKGVCPYYMFNGSTQEGVDILAAVGAFLAERYSGSAHGRISNWVIANEINARKEWNYLKYTDVDTYAREFAKGFRVLYTAIKSMSGSARVYISLDQTWDKNVANSPDYDGKDLIDSFNAYVRETGNIDWSLAYHPYNVPLTSCKTWDSSKYVSHNSNTGVISMQNIEVLVNYMNQEHFLNPDGECRSIMITELGYTSTAGEQLQAAAIAYAYLKIDHYQDIDGLLLNRQTDDATEIAQNLATGITKSNGAAKYSYNVFKYMDTDQRDKYLDFAKSIIGINNWSEIYY